MQDVPEATVARLPLYLRALLDLAEDRVTTTSSERIAQMTGETAATVRRDLSHIGSYGRRGVGYDVRFLLFGIRNELGLDHEWAVVVAGAGNLGSALTGYRGFAERGFAIVALVDTDPDKLGTTVRGVPVIAPDQMPAVVEEHPSVIGVIATPPAAAQEVAEAFVRAGVASILNFAPAIVSVEGDVSVRAVDLALEMQVLTFYAQRRETQDRAASAS